MRQTLLSFPSIPRKKREAVAAAQLKLPRPAPEVPPEVWDIILEDLSTISLKTLRLVCQSWSWVGTARLFRTVYLNGYETSWKRLEQLAASKHAQLVTTIVWNPLVLYENCLDGEIWRERYPNLLQGLSHSESLRLHKLFRRTRTETRHPKVSLSKYVDSLQKEGSNNFVNCRQFIIADDSDIETKCANEYFRRRIQSDPMLLKEPAIWGRYPQWWVRCSENKEVFDSVPYIFQLINQTQSISHMKISMWGEHVDTVLSYLNLRICSEGLPCIRSFEMQLKFCTVVNVDFEHLSLGSVIGPAFSALVDPRKFGNMQDLVFESVYTNAGRDFIKFYKQLQQKERLSDETDDDVSDSTGQVSCTSSIYSSVSALDGTSGVLPDELTRDFLGPYEAILHFPTTRLQQLKSLTLHNVTINARALIAWLCNQPQLPESQMTLQLKGPTILHGSNLDTFLQVLAQLNVRLTYDARTTLWYNTVSLDRMVNEERISWWDYAEGKVRKGLYYTIDLGWENEKWSDYDYAEPLKPQQMPDQDTKRVQSPPSAKFLHRPWTINYIISSIDEDRSIRKFFYCLVCDHDQKYTFEWLNESEYYSKHTRFVSGKPEAEAVIVVRTWTHKGYDDYYDYDHHGYLEQLEFYEAEAQAALLVYENELFRQDVVDSTGEVTVGSSGAALRESLS